LKLISGHKQDISQGNNVRDHAGLIDVQETIDASVMENVASFITHAVIAVKGVQDVFGLFGMDIGFLFQKQDQFTAGIDGLYASNRHFLASYLKMVRGFWNEKLFARRNALEHEGWALPDFTYKRMAAGKIQAVEPPVDDLPVSDYLIIMSNRIFSFIENIVVYGIQQKLGSGETIVEIPAGERDPAVVVRFKILPRSEVRMEWDIRYSEDDFCDNPSLSS